MKYTHNQKREEYNECIGRLFLKLIFFPFTQIHKFPLYTASYQFLHFPLDNLALGMVCRLLPNGVSRYLIEFMIMSVNLSRKFSKVWYKVCYSCFQDIKKARKYGLCNAKLLHFRYPRQLEIKVNFPLNEKNYPICLRHFITNGL